MCIGETINTITNEAQITTQEAEIQIASQEKEEDKRDGIEIT